MALKNVDKIEITLVSDPRKFNLLRAYNNQLNQFTNDPTGLAKEIRYLRDRGLSTVKFKDGTMINLKDIDLDGLNWGNWKY